MNLFLSRSMSFSETWKTYPPKRWSARYIMVPHRQTFMCANIIEGRVATKKKKENDSHDTSPRPLLCPFWRVNRIGCVWLCNSAVVNSSEWKHTNRKKKDEEEQMCVITLEARRWKHACVCARVWILFLHDRSTVATGSIFWLCVAFSTRRDDRSPRAICHFQNFSSLCRVKGKESNLLSRNYTKRGKIRSHFVRYDRTKTASEKRNFCA